MTRPLLMDLFCGLGGAAHGYVRAGFDVVGVDVKPQPDYLGSGALAFVQGDALVVGATLLKQGWRGRPFATVHASPPCAAYTAIVNGTNAGKGDHPRLYEPTAHLLDESGLAYVIENPAARPDLVLCGSQLPSDPKWGVLRHRRFELGRWEMPRGLVPEHQMHAGYVRGWRHGVYREGTWPDGRTYVAIYGKGGGKATLPEARAALGIHWSEDLAQTTQAIPPAFTQVIGQGLRHWMGYL